MSQTIGFVLLDGFDFRSYWAAVEALLGANVATGRDLYHWVRLSTTGRSVRSADGESEAADFRLDDDLPLDGLVVCAGDYEATETEAPGWLDDLTERVDPASGSVILLTAPSLSEGHAEASAHGGGAFDMMLELVDRQHGEAVAQAVTDWRRKLQSSASEAGPQRPSLFERFGVRNEALLRAIAFIGARAAESPPSAEVAKAAGVSLKKLRALFAAHLGYGMKDLAFEMRLNRAHWLLQMTSMPIDEVARVSGFHNTNTLVRAYRRRFGQSPKRERALSDQSPSEAVPPRRRLKGIR